MYTNILLKIEQILKSINNYAYLGMIPDQINGHFATNLLLLNKSYENEIKEKLSCYVEKFQIVDGFLNMTLKHEILENISFDYNFGKNESISLEYCSPNPTGPIHLGHCRNIVIGKTMDNVLKFCGYNVLSELYMNDCGNQINQFKETIGYWQDIKNYGSSDKKRHYLGDYMKELSEKCSVDNVLQYQIDLIINKLELLGIKYDCITYESSLNTNKTIETLYEKNLITDNIDGSIWLKDKVLKKQDKTYTYFANDITYHLLKKKNHTKLIVVLGEDQRGNFTHLKKLLLDHFNINLEIILIGTVHVKQNNEILTLSKRNGNIITIDDVLNHMSVGEMFCSLLDAKLHKSIIIDYDNKSLDNTMFYFKYLINLIPQINVQKNNLTQEDHSILGMILFWPKILRESIKINDPHKLFVYIKNLLQKIYNYVSDKNMINNVVKNNIWNILNDFSQIIHN